MEEGTSSLQPPPPKLDPIDGTLSLVPCILVLYLTMSCTLMLGHANLIPFSTDLTDP